MKILNEIWEFPKLFLQWIVFHLAQFLDMKVVPDDIDLDEIFKDDDE